MSFFTPPCSKYNIVEHDGKILTPPCSKYNIVEHDGKILTPPVVNIIL